RSAIERAQCRAGPIAISIVTMSGLLVPWQEQCKGGENVWDDRPWCQRRKRQAGAKGAGAAVAVESIRPNYRRLRCHPRSIGKAVPASQRAAGNRDGRRGHVGSAARI